MTGNKAIRLIFKRLPLDAFFHNLKNDICDFMNC